ncbi:hypothetical protein GRF59_12940 [Paenibacillus sp. HJL G12]|uniref:Uncharacterized protein n=1 Tax=Paenibacillus dendrobii TaxID=2691084 RepID=A0A7X3IIF4_9BACL|nr:hypothetical protein [Paenibacillus dendrobii]MWV44534.1 hypothetical protein [Paenibacillus dendrobii]
MRNNQPEDQHEDFNAAALKRYEKVSRSMETASFTNGNDVDWESMTSPEQTVTHESHMFDIDRMINEGLGGGEITADNGFIGDSTTDSIVWESKENKSGKE